MLNKDSSQLVKSQLHFYFSDENLRFDKFLRTAICQSGSLGWIPISMLLTFNKLKSLIHEERLLKESILSVFPDEILELNQEQTCIRRKSGLPSYQEMILAGDNRILLVCSIPLEIQNKVDALSLQIPAQVVLIRFVQKSPDFAFVHFVSESECLKAYSQLPKASTGNLKKLFPFDSHQETPPVSEPFCVLFKLVLQLSCPLSFVHRNEYLAVKARVEKTKRKDNLIFMSRDCFEQKSQVSVRKSFGFHLKDSE